MGQAREREGRWGQALRAQAPFALGAGLLAGGCSEATVHGGLLCLDVAPEPGPVIVKTVSCRAERFADGDNRSGDTLLTNGLVKAIVRNPIASNTLAGFGGGTVVDLGAWEAPDLIHEIAPVVDDAWMTVDSFELDDEGVTVSGPLRSLPGFTSESEGEIASVRWSLRPDDPWVHLEGAEGMWILTRGGQLGRIGETLASSAGTFVTDGNLEDLGGAYLARGATRVRIGPSQEVWADLAGEAGQPLSVDLEPDTTLALRSAGVTVGRLYPVEGRVETTVPLSVDQVRAEGGGRVAGPWTPTAEGLTLAPGVGGSIRLHLDWAGPPRPVEVRFTGQDGRSGRSVVDPGGGTVQTGPGQFELTLSAGPSNDVTPLFATVSDDEAVLLGATIHERFNPGNHVLISQSANVDRSRDFRRSTSEAISRAAVEGSRVVVLAPPDEVAEGGVPSSVAPWIDPIFASMAVPESGGWLVAWPWSADPKAWAHGAIDHRGMSPEQVLYLMSGGATNSRRVLVSQSFLTTLTTPPDQVKPRPEWVALPHPGLDPAVAWAPWFAWLDAGTDLLPWGDVGWAKVADPLLASAAEAELSWTRGRYTAGDGDVVIEMAIDDKRPGDTFLVGAPRRDLELFVRGAPGSVDRIAVYGDGQVLAQWDVDALPVAFVAPIDAGPRWVVAVAWSSTGWGVTAPIWLRGPS